MNCPRCTGGGNDGMTAYRGAVRRGTAVALLPERSDLADVSFARCPSCRGAFVEYEALLAVENARRKAKPRAERGLGVARRAYDPPTEAIACPACTAETTRREWSIGTLLYVDVCIECRGVWLDGGELEAIG